MKTAYIIIFVLVVIFTVLPKVPSTHWVFRIADFGKIQVFFVGVFLWLFGWLLPMNMLYISMQALLFLLLLYHGIILVKYTRLYRIKKLSPQHTSSQPITIISANVYQFNTDYTQFIALIRKYKPDVFLTMESNKEWELALEALEQEYPYQHKIGLENTYGMHLYSRLRIKKSTSHFFVADDIPSIEAEIVTADGYSMVVFGVHPPPPSPTEEETSKERDGDLLSVAKRVKELHLPTIVVGDFNNVAWSKSSILFRKTSELIDPRIGHGFVSTFHATYKWLRFPIDLIFHSPDIFVTQLNTLENFGSDHLAVYCKFFIDAEIGIQEEMVETATTEELVEVEEMIEEGIEEEGERDEVATE